MKNAKTETREKTLKLLDVLFGEEKRFREIIPILIPTPLAVPTFD